MTHPIRDAELHVYERVDAHDKGPQFIARLYPYKTYTVFGQGDTYGEAVAQIEALRTEAIEKHEADVIRRQEASQRMKERAANKKAEAAE